MVVKICIGSSCHLKGSREVIQNIQKLVLEYNLSELVEIKGEFCMERCLNGVCVQVDQEIYSVSPESTKEFFQEKILRRIPS